MLLDEITNVIVNDINQLEYNNQCLISNEFLDIANINNNNVIKLNCGHSFKYDYFLKSLRIMNRNKEGYNKCPYCFSNVGRIPLILTRKKLSKIALKMTKKEFRRKRKLSLYKDANLSRDQVQLMGKAGIAVLD